MASTDKPRGSVLVADEEASARELALVLRDAGWSVDACSSQQRLPRLLRERPPQVLVCDPESLGIDPFEALSALDPIPALVVLSSFGSVDDAVEAMRKGAFDYLCKPLSPEQALVSVARASESVALRVENAALKRTLADRFDMSGFHTRDPALRALLASVEAVADTRATVLIEGESGTGKTLLARALHQRSGRAQKPFVELNCGAIPASLLESELFGVARGAFTGASRDREGRFEAADGGTLFLDEIGTASLDLQVKLLRAIQDRTFERVGETRTRTSDVRLVAATNVELAGAVAAGTFREDLYYRLRVVALRLPPLRDRVIDVPLLSEAFLERYAKEHSRPAKSLAPEALARLVAHRWPGNVRELEHAIERAVLLANAPQITPADLGPDFAVAAEPRSALPSLSAGATLKSLLEAPEREIILRALEQCGGNRKQTARLLDVNRATLFNKMRKYNLMEFPARSE